jgi:hypothetical protein
MVLPSRRIYVFGAPGGKGRSVEEIGSDLQAATGMGDRHTRQSPATTPR